MAGVCRECTFFFCFFVFCFFIYFFQCAGECLNQSNQATSNQATRKITFRKNIKNGIIIRLLLLQFERSAICLTQLSNTTLIFEKDTLRLRQVFVKTDGVYNVW